MVITHFNWNNCRRFFLVVGFSSLFSRMVDCAVSVCGGVFFVWCILLGVLLNDGFHSPFSNSSFSTWFLNHLRVCVCVCGSPFSFTLPSVAMAVCLLLHFSLLNSLFDYFQSYFFLLRFRLFLWLPRPHISIHAFTKVSTFKFELYFLISYPCRPVLFAYLLARSLLQSRKHQINSVRRVYRVCGVSKYIKMLLF